MPDSAETTRGAERRFEPIVQENERRRSGHGKVRRSGRKAQARIAVVVLFALGGVVGVAYIAFMRPEPPYVLTDYDVATATITTIEDSIELSGTVAARAEADVTAPEQGYLDRLLVAEGSAVAKGQPVLILDAAQLKDELESLERSLESSQREYDRVLLQREYEVARSQRSLANLREAVMAAEEDLIETQELLDVGAATRAEVADAEDRVENAQEAVEDLEAEIEESAALHELSVANYEDTLAVTEAEIVDVRERLAETTVTAPISGTVISLADTLSVAGAVIKQYDTLMSIADTRRPLVLTEIEEQYVPYVEVGRLVAVEISSGAYIGTIERIGLVASTTSDGGTPTVELDVGIDDESVSVLPGGSAAVTILLGETPDALVLPRGSYLTTGNRRYVYRIEGDQAIRTEVTYGVVKDQSVQILSGLEAGDRIISSGYQNFIDEDVIELGGQR